MTEDKAELAKIQIRAENRRCVSCAAFARLLYTMLDSRTGKSVRLYQCQCGERIWDE
jgi:hypothetical protein